MKFAVTVLIVLSAFTASSFGENPSRPNVLFILIDDFGWKDVGYNGSTFYETPQIDKLSKEWMRFDSCYTPSPMCSPTRASILTGKNPARHGITQWLPGIDRAYARRGDTPRVYCPGPQSPTIKESEVTLGEAFQEAGYETAFYGKWHMGDFPLSGGPKNHGYDSQVAVIERNGCAQFSFKRYFKQAKPGQSFNDALTDAAIDYVTAKRDKPFYLHLCHFAMHLPISTSPELRAKFEAKKNALGLTTAETKLDDYAHHPWKLQQDSAEYAGELYNLDSNIGRLVDALKKSGQYENTIIVFTGDNGGRTSTKSEHATAVAPLRGGKTYVFEGGLRTPTLIYWPGHTKAGMHTDTPINSMDFYPTLLEMAGLPLKPEQHLDGLSIVPLFKGQPVERGAQYWHFPHYQKDGSYPSSAIRVGDYKLIHNYHHDDLLLFKISEDPHETKNLAKSMPEKAAALNKQLMDYLKETGAYLPQPPTPEQRMRKNKSRKSKNKKVENPIK
ncbi:sulfatase [Pontiella agarivorans]|uniref:Sulfatase n=1 Tax=Pontiella agarivorans TaxID=3038953 RepID=A0ABU5MS52_9BACT|nr:sulfatase [Pontiella agarivorans]MDZ8117023.1 sulfatase [Pontiella agarivorans]